MQRGRTAKTWGETARQLCREFFAHPFSLSYAWELGREHRRRFDAWLGLGDEFSLAARGDETVAPLRRVATWSEMTGSWRLSTDRPTPLGKPVFFLPSTTRGSEGPQVGLFLGD